MSVSQGGLQSGDRVHAVLVGQAGDGKPRLVRSAGACNGPRQGRLYAGRLVGLAPDGKPRVHVTRQTRIEGVGLKPGRYRALCVGLAADGKPRFVASPQRCDLCPCCAGYPPDLELTIELPACFGLGDTYSLAVPVTSIAHAANCGVTWYASTVVEGGCCTLFGYDPVLFVQAQVRCCDDLGGGPVLEVQLSVQLASRRILPFYEVHLCYSTSGSGLVVVGAACPGGPCSGLVLSGSYALYPSATLNGSGLDCCRVVAGVDQYGNPMYYYPDFEGLEWQLTPA